MDDKTSGVVKDICTILGGALLLYPIIDEATKTIIPEMEKLQSGETLKELKMLPEKQEEKPEEKSKSKDEKISELKRKLSELESKDE